jgi:hypothetical protein
MGQHMRQSVRRLVALVITLVFLSLQAKAQIRMTAGSLKTALDSLAATFATDAKLALVTCSEVDTAGKSSVWRYVYFSFDSLKEYQFLAQNYHISFDASRGMRVGIGILDVPWIDSDSALSVAQWKGGYDIRRRFPTCTITATLVRYIAPPSLCYWQIDYVCGDSTRAFQINAASGDIVTLIRGTDNSTLPIQSWLHQNYPNPFNPSTIIEFTLPSASVVSLKVFNVLGQEVAAILDRPLPLGTHQVRWNAHALAGGTYFYRLIADTHTETKKLVLQK